MESAPPPHDIGENVESWDKRSALDPLAAVIDSADTTGLKNAHIHRIHSKVLLQAARFDESDRVLDFGCGNGRMSAVAAPRARRVTGVDISAEMLRSARKLYGGLCDFVAYDGTRLPFGDRAFDAFFSVITVQIFCAKPARFRQIVTEIARTLRPGADVTMIERMVPEQTSDEWTAARWNQELASCGFEVEGIRPVRSGSLTKVTAAVIEDRVPKALLGAAASVEITLSRRRGVTAPYTECLIKARRV